MSDLDALEHLLSSFRRSIFRLEALDRYSVEGETEVVDAFLRGDLELPRTPAIDAFFAHIRQERAEGRIRTRVHAIAGPLTPYLRYEVEWGYTACAAAGEEIHILHTPSWRESPFSDQPPDFYLVDDETTAVMRYDDEGHWLGFDLVTHPDQLAEYRRLRDLALQHATPLQQYLAAMRVTPIDPLKRLRGPAEWVPA
jgi:Family of unknown function (DUF6879)